MKPPVSEQVTAAAVAWNAARIEASRLRRQRVLHICELEERGVGVPPCWRNWEDDGDGDRTLLPRSEWCSRCIDRQAVHEQYRGAVKRRAALQRGLQARCRKLTT